MAASEGRRCILVKRIPIGFIGAGKVGVSLGKYFKEKGLQVGGYYSRTHKSARWAAAFTQSTYYENLQEMISSCEIILFTVPDGAIASLWEMVKPYISGKIIGHCSGLHSSKIFSDAGKANCFAYSIHPLMAVNSRENSWREFSNTLFTIEGDEKYLYYIEEILRGLGNKTRIISTENKIKYHAAAAILSNHLTALFDISQTLFEECGFMGREELYYLAEGSLTNILKEGCMNALTGPVERNDVETVRKHVSVLEKETRIAYLANTAYLIRIAEKKHPDRDYSEMKNLCETLDQIERGIG